MLLFFFFIQCSSNINFILEIMEFKKSIIGVIYVIVKVLSCDTGY